jgi:hypothetical protein
MLASAARVELDSGLRPGDGCDAADQFGGSRRHMGILCNGSVHIHPRAARLAFLERPRAVD